MKDSIVSNELKELLLEWDKECARFRKADKVFSSSMDNLNQLNIKIYNLSLAEGKKHDKVLVKILPNMRW